MEAEGTLTRKFADFTATNSSYVYNQLMDAAVTMCLSYDTIVSTMLFSGPWKSNVASTLRQIFECNRASYTCRRSVIGNNFLYYSQILRQIQQRHI